MKHRLIGGSQPALRVVQTLLIQMMFANGVNIYQLEIRSVSDQSPGGASRYWFLEHSSGLVNAPVCVFVGFKPRLLPHHLPNCKLCI
jgi:hypothetical protein